jgi:hypothetical protein
MSCVACRAIDHLRSVRDAVELAMRPPGDRVTITRQVAEAILDDLGIASCLIRRMAEHGHG